jgi:hypothetical protein
MNNKTLPTGYADHDLATKSLFETKSLNALKFLIDNGRELEFQFGGVDFFLSCSSSAQYVSIWGNGFQQSFDSMDALIENAILNQIPFSTAWDRVELRYLF